MRPPTGVILVATLRAEDEGAQHRTPVRV
jgi:hypothetical protein